MERRKEKERKWDMWSAMGAKERRESKTREERISPKRQLRGRKIEVMIKNLNAT